MSIKKLTISSFLTIFFLSGCVPKLDKLYVMETPKSNTTAEITMLRNFNIYGYGLRFYPMINNKKLAGLYTNNHINYYIEEGKYTFSLTYPAVGYNTWLQGNSIELDVKANKQYYFLLTPYMMNSVLVFNIEIEEISKEEATERLSNSRLVQTGTLSKRINNVETFDSVSE